MYGALDANRLCLLSLGNKHDYGLDGVPQDLEQAYGKHFIYNNGQHIREIFFKVLFSESDSGQISDKQCFQTRSRNF